VTATEVYMPMRDAEIEIVELLSQEHPDQGNGSKPAEFTADNELGLSPDELICRDRARRDADVLRTFVEIGRLSLSDMESLLQTGSRRRIVDSLVGNNLPAGGGVETRV